MRTLGAFLWGPAYYMGWSCLVSESVGSNCFAHVPMCAIGCDVLVHVVALISLHSRAFLSPQRGD